MAWNQGGNDGRAGAPRTPQAQGTKHKAQGTLIKGIVAGLVVVIGAVGAFVWITSGNDAAEAASTKEKKPAKIADGKVVEQHLEVPEEKVPEKPKKFWEVDASQTNGFTKAQQRKWEIAHQKIGYYYTNTSHRAKAPEAIFKHRSENEIAVLLNTEPGRGFIGTPNYKGITEDFLASCKEPVEILPTDTPEQVELKKMVEGAKAEIKARIDAGEDLGKMLEEAREEMRELARYKQVLQNELHEFEKRDDMTEKDLDDYLKAANQMLEEKGIAPLTLGPIAKRRLATLKEGNN